MVYVKHGGIGYWLWIIEKSHSFHTKYPVIKLSVKKYRFIYQYQRGCFIWNVYDRTLSRNKQYQRRKKNRAGNISLLEKKAKNIVTLWYLTLGIFYYIKDILKQDDISI